VFAAPPTRAFDVSSDLTNVGDRAGDEVAQLDGPR
jgi:hypothetical protein